MCIVIYGWLTACVYISPDIHAEDINVNNNLLYMYICYGNVKEMKCLQFVIPTLNKFDISTVYGMLETKLNTTAITGTCCNQACKFNVQLC